MVIGSELESRQLRQRWSWLLCLLCAVVMSWASQSVSVWAQDEGKKEEAAAATEEPAEAKAEAAPAGEGDAAPAPEQKSALKWLIDASGPFGLIIIAESFLLFGLIISGVMLFRRQNFIPADFVDQFEQKINAKDYPGAFELAKKDESFTGKLVAEGMGRLPKGYEDAVAGMQSVAEDENMTLDHKLSYISLIGATAPMLGLLGTVQGMVSAFMIIASSTTSPKPNELAEGIVLALVTTLEGLIVAIPAIVGYGLLKNRQGRLVHDAIAAGDSLIQKVLGSAKKPANPA